MNTRVQPASARATDAPVRALRRRQLLVHVESHLDNPALSPGNTAAALGWSLRQVHAVLDGEPLSFMRHVSRLRLDRARALLQQGHGPVIEVAFACGFDSLATFYRQYAAAFGSTPAAERSRSGALQRPPECGRATAPCTQ